jgi:hypothetical protein
MGTVGPLDVLFEYRNAAAQTLAHATPSQLGEAATFVNECITFGILPVKSSSKHDPYRDAAVISKMYWMWLISVLEEERQDNSGIFLHDYLVEFHKLVADFGAISDFHKYVEYGGPLWVE